MRYLFEIQAATEKQEQVMLRLATGELEREAFVNWFRDHIQPKA